jgi:iron complex transport system substrate-binding protein
MAHGGDHLRAISAAFYCLSRWGRRIVASALIAALPVAASAQAPQRVVSMNVCTDQLAMLLAGEGQLLSVSFLAADPATSAMVEEAANYPLNHGLAEEIFLLKPDLVLAGTYGASASVAMLRRLGFRVETFDPESSFDDILANIRRVGGLLGQEERAEALASEMEAELAGLDAMPKLPQRVAVYSANSYTSGAGSLSDAVIEAAGLVNMSAELGIVGVAPLPLETLVMEEPDIILRGDSAYATPALAQQNFAHPAYRASVPPERQVSIPDASWICGGPFTLEAVHALRAAAERLRVSR